jgi:hypothetical protein
MGSVSEFSLDYIPTIQNLARTCRVVGRILHFCSRNYLSELMGTQLPISMLVRKDSG